MVVNVTLPVYNGERMLAANVEILYKYFCANLLHEWHVVIAVNGSTDRSYEIASGLSERFEKCHAVRIEEKGRGGALKRVWQKTDADIMSYMDLDLSTELEAFPRLISRLPEDELEIATGSRVFAGSCTSRSLMRELISRCYNNLVKFSMSTSQFSDSQCGFKALKANACSKLLPLIKNTNWFFDTELMVLAEKLRIPIGEIPIKWTEDCDSTVR